MDGGRRWMFNKFIKQNKKKILIREKKIKFKKYKKEKYRLKMGSWQEAGI